jgi:hypothetical protein
MGSNEGAISTLKEIYTEIQDHPESLQISYYNNLLYFIVTSDCFEETEEIYAKLMELLSIEENKIYESDAVKDTIETYKLYKTDGIPS